jgi:hypothetical protein
LIHLFGLVDFSCTCFSTSGNLNDDSSQIEGEMENHGDPFTEGDTGSFLENPGAGTDNTPSRKVKYQCVAPRNQNQRITNSIDTGSDVQRKTEPETIIRQ